MVLVVYVINKDHSYDTNNANAKNVKFIKVWENRTGWRLLTSCPEWIWSTMLSFAPMVISAFWLLWQGGLWSQSPKHNWVSRLPGSLHFCRNKSLESPYSSFVEQTCIGIKVRRQMKSTILSTMRRRYCWRPEKVCRAKKPCDKGGSSWSSLLWS